MLASKPAKVMRIGSARRMTAGYLRAGRRPAGFPKSPSSSGYPPFLGSCFRHPGAGARRATAPRRISRRIWRRQERGDRVMSPSRPMRPTGVCAVIFFSKSLQPRACVPSISTPPGLIEWTNGIGHDVRGAVPSMRTDIPLLLSLKPKRSLGLTRILPSLIQAGSDN